jgi:hypothetical protein
MHTKCLQQDRPLQELWDTSRNGHILLIHQSIVQSKEESILNDTMVGYIGTT